MKMMFLCFAFLMTASLTNTPLVFSEATETNSPCHLNTHPLNASEPLNTTNPYSDATPESVWDEVDDAEGDRPLYLLVFGDEEARATLHGWPGWDIPLPWDWYARGQLERGDETHVALFGIDIRILDFLEWDSDDATRDLGELQNELINEHGSYLGQDYEGEWWHDKVDAIFGVVGQEVEPEQHSKGASHEYVDQGKVAFLIKWRVYWADDNRVQHEISHLFHTDDHPHICWNMAFHPHPYRGFMWEDDLWWVNGDISCSDLTYTYCSPCNSVINLYADLYNLHLDNVLILRHETPIEPRGTFYLIVAGVEYKFEPGIYFFSEPIVLTITVKAHFGHLFDYWLVKGTEKIDTTTTVTITVDNRLSLACYYAPKHCPRYWWAGGAGKHAIPR